MEPIEITSLADYVKYICDLNVNRNTLQNEEFLYRGHSNVKYELLPYVGRKKNDDKSDLEQERNLIEMAKFKMPDIFRNDMLPLELLALLQHHEIPTRLLDVTENALVALYFACSSPENIDKDGEVFVFCHCNDDVANYPLVQSIADSYRLIINKIFPLELFFQLASNQEYFSEYKMYYNSFMSDQKLRKLVNLDKIILDTCSKPIFVYAPVRTLRQQMQSGRYILFPNKIDSTKNGTKYFVNEIKPIKKDDNCIRMIYTIKKESKRDILNDLKIMGICRKSLFCDNIDTVCEEIKNTFVPKKANTKNIDQPTHT